MSIELSPRHAQLRREFSEFVNTHIAPHAARYDREQHTPPELIRHLGELGWLGATVPGEWGGRGLDALGFGLLCEELGRCSASLLSLLTVHSMVCQVLLKWGSDAQRRHWLPRLATGASVAAFGLSEPDVGSDARSVQTRAETDSEDYILKGRKQWISFGQCADLFLIMAQHQGAPCAFLVERERPGFGSEPIHDMLGFRAAMLASLHLEDCRIPAGNLVGAPGFGFSHIVNTALDQGRYCIAWGCLGLGEACLAASLAYSSERQQFDAPLKDHQLIQRMIADMITDLGATRLLCHNAARLKDQGDPALIMETAIAKYFASRTASRVANDAVQIHGANGCSDAYPVARHWRDARIMEIIEGSNQIQQLIIARAGYQEHAAAQRRSRRQESAP